MPRTIDLDNPTQEDISTLIDKANRCAENFFECNDSSLAFYEARLDEQKVPHLQKMVKIWSKFKKQSKNMAKMFVVVLATLYFCQFYYTGEERYKEAAFELIPKKDLEEIIDDRPPLEIVK